MNSNASFTKKKIEELKISDCEDILKPLLFSMLDFDPEERCPDGDAYIEIIKVIKILEK